MKQTLIVAITFLTVFFSCSELNESKLDSQSNNISNEEDSVLFEDLNIRVFNFDSKPFESNEMKIGNGADIKITEHIVLGDTLQVTDFTISKDNVTLYNLGLIRDVRGRIGYSVCCDSICDYYYQNYEIRTRGGCSWGSPESHKFGIYFKKSLAHNNNISLISIENKFNIGLIELEFDNSNSQIRKIKFVYNKLK